MKFYSSKKFDSQSLFVFRSVRWIVALLPQNVKIEKFGTRSAGSVMIEVRKALRGFREKLSNYWTETRLPLHASSNEARWNDFMFLMSRNKFWNRSWQTSKSSLMSWSPCLDEKPEDINAKQADNIESNVCHGFCFLFMLCFASISQWLRLASE